MPALSTNGTLTFAAQAHSFGTNLVTVTLTDNNPLESTNNGGIKTFSQSFWLQVVEIPHVPTISPATTQTVLENSAGILITNNVWNYDAIANNLALTALSAPFSNTLTSVVTITPVLTTAISSTNTQFTWLLTPVANLFGTNVITLTASNLLETAITTNATFKVVVPHVTQAPSFVFATNTVTTLEQSWRPRSPMSTSLTAITNGAGNLPPYTNWTFKATAANPALFSAQPAIAHNGTLTFTPKAQTSGTNMVTVVMTDTDTGESTANGGVTTFTNTFTLGVATPITVANSSGIFTGLFYGSNHVAAASSGYVSLALTNGGFTGYLLCGNDSNTFAGQFDMVQSTATVQASNPLTTNYMLNLNADMTAMAISGSVSNTATGWSSQLQAYLSGYCWHQFGWYVLHDLARVYRFPHWHGWRQRL